MTRRQNRRIDQKAVQLRCPAFCGGRRLKEALNEFFDRFVEGHERNLLT